MANDEAPLKKPCVTLFGLEFSSEPADEVLRHAEAASESGVRLVATINVDHVVTLRRDAEFRRAYCRAVQRTLDGMPLVLLAKLRGQADARRVTGHDLLASLLRRRCLEQDRVFAVCATVSVANALERLLADAGWELERIATIVPKFGVESEPAESERLCRAIRAHQTTWLLMGVGAPKSEKWVMRMGSALGAPVVLCIGDALNVAAGISPRAPEWMQRSGLEWAWRFALSPRRLFRRYFVRSLQFTFLALTNPDFRV